MSRWRVWFQPLLCAWLAWAIWPAHAALQIKDDRGVVVRLERSPQRIVSLLPSLAEAVCALGQCHRLVGVDRYTNWPMALQSLPRVGGGLDPSVEQIVALRPDVVLMSTATRVADRLQSLGIPVLALETQTHADVQRVLSTLGTLMEVGDAPAVWRRIEAELQAAAQSLPAHVRGVRVYFEVNTGPYAAGERSFIGETLARLGVSNIVSASLGPFPKLNPEFVVRADPDLILIGEHGRAGLQQRPGWSRLRAIQGQHLCVFTAEETDTLSRPGPRMAEAARLLTRCLSDRAPARKATAG